MAQHLMARVVFARKRVRLCNGANDWCARWTSYGSSGLGLSPSPSHDHFVLGLVASCYRNWDKFRCAESINPSGTRVSPKNTFFNRLISFFGCRDAKWAYVFKL